MSSTPKSLPLAEPAEGRRGRTDLPLNPAMMVLFRSWKIIAILTIGAMVASALCAKFLMTKWYRAEAILRPVSQLMPNELVDASMGSQGTSAPAVSSDILLVFRAEEALAILKSFDFNLAVAERHHLKGELLARVSPWHRGTDPRWDVFRELEQRFGCQYSISTGSALLSYLDPDRTTAERNLGYYIDDLREKLRDEQIRDTKTAAATLESQAQSTSDSILQAQLYLMVAVVLRQQKLAMVDADFAFRVIQSPVASDIAYSPNVKLVAGLTGIVVLFLCCLAMLIRDWLQRMRIANSPGTLTRGKRDATGVR
jgi:hypothetical protein